MAAMLTVGATRLLKFRVMLSMGVVKQSIKKAKLDHNLVYRLESGICYYQINICTHYYSGNIGVLHYHACVFA